MDKKLHDLNINFISRFFVDFVDKKIHALKGTELAAKTNCQKNQVVSFTDEASEHLHVYEVQSKQSIFRVLPEMRASRSFQ